MHSVVEERANGGLLGAGLKVAPAGLLRHPEDIVGGILVAIFDDAIARLRLLDEIIALRVGDGKFELLMLLLEGVGNVLQEYQPENHVLVDRRVHVAAHLVRRRPQRRLEAQLRAVVGFFLLSSRHTLPLPC